MSLVFCRSTVAQQPPQLGYTYPPVASVGQTIEISLGGYNLTPDTQYRIIGKGVQLQILGEPGELVFPGAPYWFGPRALNSYKPFPISREVPARISVSKDASPQIVRLIAHNANGVGESISFVIDNPDTVHLAEETLTDRSGIREITSLPCEIHGRLSRKEEVDQFQWTASVDGLITIELPKENIGAPLNAALHITSASGQVVADHVDTHGVGIQVTFRASKGKAYRIRLSDMDYRGNHAMVYRMRMRRGPHVTAMLPCVLKANDKQNVTFIGYGIASGQPVLESIQQTVQTGSESFVYSLHSPQGSAGNIPVEVASSSDSVLIETSPGSITPISPGDSISGTLQGSDGSRVFEFAATEGQAWQVVCRSHTTGQPLTFQLELYDSEQNLVSTSVAAPGEEETILSVTPKKDGPHYIVLRELSRLRHGLDCVYRLQFRKPQPSFQMKLPESVSVVLEAEPPTAPKRRRAGKQAPGLIGIDIVRQGGFTGAVQISFDERPDRIDLPSSVTIDEKSAGIDIPILCDRLLGPRLQSVGVRATATVDGAVVERQGTLQIASVLKPRCVVYPKYPDAARTVKRGMVYPAPVVIERVEGFTGPVRLEIAGIPDRVRQGIIGVETQVPAGQDAADYPLIVPDWVQTDRTSRIYLNAVVQYTDPSGTVHYLVNRMQKRITLNVEGALLKVSSSQKHFEKVAGDAVAIPVDLFRSGELEGPVQVTLRPAGTRPDPERWPLVTLDPQTTSTVLHWPDAEPATSASALAIPNASLVETLSAQWPSEFVPAQNRVDEIPLVLRAQAFHRGSLVISETHITIAAPVEKLISR